ncbi:MAG: serine/threonine protein phosphatase [Pseudoxanthomonas sp.]
MVESITFQGRRAWLKQYGTHHRGGALRLLDGVADWLDAAALKPPPHHSGARAKQTEMRRLGELRAQGVHVPEVLGDGKATLILSDNGPSLGACMGEAANDPVRLDMLTASAADAIRRGHRDGAYFGQPVPRNMTFDGERIGFIDFEEDPLEVMTLEQAQARDWLLFAHGASKRYADRPQALAGLLHEQLSGEAEEVVAHANHVATRLGRITRMGRHLGRYARLTAQAVLVVQVASTFALVLGVALGFDWLLDGELDLLKFLA